MYYKVNRFNNSRSILEREHCFSKSPFIDLRAQKGIVHVYRLHARPLHAL